MDHGSFLPSKKISCCPKFSFQLLGFSGKKTMLDPHRLLLHALFLLFSLHSFGSSDGLPEAPCCKRPSLAQIFLHSPDEVVIGELVNRVSLVPRVLELNESSATLEQTLSSLWSASKVESSAMLLLYASWCPFSKLMRPLFDTMSSIYPSVYHIAVEESSVRPSVLSKYGVNSFPTLIHLTSKSRTRFHGSKDLKNLASFYKDMTGFSPEVQGSSEALILHSSQGRSPAGMCPYISPEKLLEGNMYLTLAACFLALRLAFLLLPVATKSLKWWWERSVANLFTSRRQSTTSSSSSHSSVSDGNPRAAEIGEDLPRRNRRAHESGTGNRWASSSTSFSPVPIGLARPKSQHLYE
ncbi:5'-adenylylsulfate reductase-like 2 [Selaginella moellendorffii]|uniref:5'-adenylylsulfate reductase-like 2 n=1 Tax=Selaginella moellendorffii TaxID=88036 RepID=UPI000D1CC7EB|nr:5'-adenylylsulfate reductase-like 2 [Selaginella moellendorffii]|eukprot:XP_024533490.1 5'-adenylylsulfate reductase-like 2 [Selaginella moellendorffii]